MFKLKKLLTMIILFCFMFNIVHFNMVFAKNLTIKDLHADKSLSGSSLRSVALSPNGKYISYLKGSEKKSSVLELWVIETATKIHKKLLSSQDLIKGKVTLSEEEKNRRERQRIYSGGIISYQWTANSKSLLVPYGGDVFLYNLQTKKSKQITNTKAFETDAKLSPKGNYLSYIRKDELYIYDLRNNKEQRLTFDATKNIRNGVAEFVVQEELDRHTGYWWSPNEEAIISTQIDETKVVRHKRIEFTKTGIKDITQNYPFAGTNNVGIKLRYTKIKGKEIKSTWLDYGKEKDIYITSVKWGKNNNFFVQILSRDQKNIKLLKYNNINKYKVLINEHNDAWINLNKDFYQLADESFIWGSERNGFHQLLHFDREGKTYQELTDVNFPITNLACVDEKNNLVYYQGWDETPTEKHLFSVGISSDTKDHSQKKLTQKNGWHNVVFSTNCQVYADNYSSDMIPTQTSLYKKNGEFLLWINENKLDNNHPYAEYRSSHLPWTYGHVFTKDGTRLEYKYLKPKIKQVRKNKTKNKKFPVIIRVYGGPHAQYVKNQWGGAFDQFLADEGYVVFKLDNRGSTNRGMKFENAIYRAMGGVEVKDQLAGAKYLASLPFVDKERIGVFGWSYGGYMTLMMLSQYPEVFKYGVSGAPVTRWRLYDTAYTERYMGDPNKEKQAYEKSKVSYYINGLKKAKGLLLIHGMADDNVFFTHSIELMSLLQKNNINFSLMTYPGEKHGFRNKNNKIHRDQTIVNFFNEKLNDK